MRRFVVFAAAVACAAGVPAIAKDKKPVDPDKKVCRRIVETGSIMGESVCHTPAEWKQIDDENEQNTHDILDRSPVNSPER